MYVKLFAVAKSRNSVQHTEIFPSLLFTQEMTAHGQGDSKAGSSNLSNKTDEKAASTSQKGVAPKPAIKPKPRNASLQTKKPLSSDPGQINHITTQLTRVISSVQTENEATLLLHCS